MKVIFDTIQALAKQPDRMMLDKDINNATATLAIQIFALSMKQWLTPISHLPLSVRANNVMKRHGLKIVYELRAMSPSDIVNLKNAGRKVRTEVHDVVQQECNLRLPNWEERFMKGAQS